MILDLSKSESIENQSEKSILEWFKGKFYIICTSYKYLFSLSEICCSFYFIWIDKLINILLLYILYTR